MHLKGLPPHLSRDLLGKYANHRSAIVKATELAFRPRDLTVGVTSGKRYVREFILHAGEFQPELISHTEPRSNAIKEKGSRWRAA